MDRSASFSTHSSSPKSSIKGETDENETRLNGIDFKSQNPKKNISKHFMSPTISATTKASVPRKKILSEKNDSQAPTPFDIPPPNCPNHDRISLEPRKMHHNNRPSFRSIAPYYCSSESDGDEQTSVKPYDPLTNYLSPRPKYLRYNPNRRREIFDLQEPTEEKEHASTSLPPVSCSVIKKFVDKQDSLEGSKDSLVSRAQQDFRRLENEDQIGMTEDDGDNDNISAQLMNQERLGDAEDDKEDGQETTEQEEEDEEEEEEDEEIESRGSSLRGFVKILLMLIAIVLSTSYISSTDTFGPPFDQITEDSNAQMCLLGNYSLNIHQEAQIDSMKSNTVNRYAILHDDAGAARRTDDMFLTPQPQDKWSKETTGTRKDLLNQIFKGNSMDISNLDNDHAELKGVDIGEVDTVTERLFQFKLSEVSEVGAETYQEMEQGSRGIQLKGCVENHDDFAEELVKHSEVMVDQHVHFGKDSSSEKEAVADFIYEVSELTGNYKSQEAGENFLEKEEETVSSGLIEEVGKDSSSEKEAVADFIYEVSELTGNYKSQEAGENFLEKEEETVSSGLIEEVGKNTKDIKFLSQETSKESVHEETILPSLMDSDKGGANVNALRNIEEPKKISQEPANQKLQEETFLSVLMDNDNAGPSEDARGDMEELKLLSQDITQENLPDETSVSTLMNSDHNGFEEKSVKPKLMIPGGMSAAQIVLPLLLVALPFLVYIIYFQRAIHDRAEDSKSVRVQLEESHIRQKSNQAAPSVDLKQLLEKNDTILRPPSALFSSEEILREKSYIHAPNAAFLGEFVIGEGENSHGSGWKQGKTTGSNHVEESYIQAPKAVFLGELVIGEGENSHTSGWKQGKTIGSNHVEESTKASYIDMFQGGSVAADYCSVEYSTTAESPSYGSFTAEKKIPKKQGSRQRDVKVITTPVRRSSRIRNLTSPSP